MSEIQSITILDIDNFRSKCPRIEKYQHGKFMDGISLRNGLTDDIKELDRFASFCDKIAFALLNPFSVCDKIKYV